MNEETIKEVEQLLMTVIGERGDNESATDVIKRLIKESRRIENIEDELNLSYEDGYKDALREVIRDCEDKFSIK